MNVIPEITWLGFVAIVTFANPEMLNVDVPIVATKAGIAIDVKLKQYVNALLPILVNDGLVGSVTDVKPAQFANTLEPIVVTELGIVIEPVKRVQFANADVSILVTELGIVYEPLLPPGYWINVV